MHASFKRPLATIMTSFHPNSAQKSRAISIPIINLKLQQRVPYVEANMYVF